MIFRLWIGYIIYQYSIFTNIKSLNEIDETPTSKELYIRYLWVLIGLGDFTKDILYLKLYPHIHSYVNYALILTIIAPFVFVSYYFKIYWPHKIII